MRLSALPSTTVRSDGTLYCTADGEAVEILSVSACGAGVLMMLSSADIQVQVRMSMSTDIAQ